MNIYTKQMNIYMIYIINILRNILITYITKYLWRLILCLKKLEIDSISKWSWKFKKNARLSGKDSRMWWRFWTSWESCAKWHDDNLASIPGLILKTPFRSIAWGPSQCLSNGTRMANLKWQDGNKEISERMRVTRL